MGFNQLIVSLTSNLVFSQFFQRFSVVTKYSSADSVSVTGTELVGQEILNELIVGYVALIVNVNSAKHKSNFYSCKTYHCTAAKTTRKREFRSTPLETIRPIEMKS